MRDVKSSSLAVAGDDTNPALPDLILEALPVGSVETAQAVDLLDEEDVSRLAV
jgi:hypothetical protein